jgi:hypothetical protein
MSVAKLLSRIAAPDKDFEEHEQLHDHTYSITSNPLTQFACVFSALIHDVDHSGVPNSQLVKENTHTSKVYRGKVLLNKIQSLLPGISSLWINIQNFVKQFVKLAKRKLVSVSWSLMLFVQQISLIRI